MTQPRHGRTGRGYIRFPHPAGDAGLLRIPIQDRTPKCYIALYRLGQQGLPVPLHRAGWPGVTYSPYRSAGISPHRAGCLGLSTAPTQSWAPGVIRIDTYIYTSPCAEADIQGLISTPYRQLGTQGLYTPVRCRRYLYPYGEPDTRSYPCAEQDALGLHIAPIQSWASGAYISL